jgi:hypothetical protein
MAYRKYLAACLPIVLLAAAACSNDLTEDLADAAPTTEPDAATLPGHVVYLVFDGVTVTTGVADDPAGNASRILAAPFTAPSFFANESNRDEKLALIADGARTILAPYNIEVVTERPATGDYDMIVFGGDPVDAGFQAGIIAYRPLECNEDKPNVSFIFENYEPLTKRYASDVVTAVGQLNNVPITNLNGDCMCGVSLACALNDALCTMGGAGTPVDPVWTCENITEADVGARFLAEFGAQ